MDDTYAMMQDFERWETEQQAKAQSEDDTPTKTETVSIETLNQVEERLERTRQTKRLREEDVLLLLKERRELAMLIRQLCAQLRKHEPEASTAQHASEYIGRHGLAGIPFRDITPGPNTI